MQNFNQEQWPVVVVTSKYAKYLLLSLYFFRDVVEETIPGGSQSYGYVDLMQTSDGLNDDVADVPVLTENPYEEVKVGECFI